MTKAQEIELAIRARAGDQTAITMLYKQYIPMMAQYCRKYRKLNTLTQEDLMQYCAIYFLQTIEKFDPSKNNKFGTMLLPQLQQLYRDVLYNDMVIRRPNQREESKTSFSCVSIDQQIDEGSDYSDLYEDLDARFWEETENVQEFAGLMEIVRSELASLDPLPRTIVELLIFTDMKNARVAECLDIDVDMVAYAIKRFRQNMKIRRKKLSE